MKQKIEKALSPLLGMPLWGASRAADMQVFQMGARHTVTSFRGKPCSVGDYALHLQCTWRIFGPSGIVTGSTDLYYPPGDPDQKPPDFDWQQGNRRDERLANLLAAESDGFSVEHVSADESGGFVLNLRGGYRLEAFPADSLPNEHWRLLKQGDLTSHFVVTGLGIET